MRFIPAILLICMSVKKCISSDLPDYFPRCSIDDPNLNKCLLNAFNTARPYIRKGIEEIGIVPFDPLVLPKIRLHQEDALNYTFTGKNFTLRGIDNYNIKQISYDPKTMDFYTIMAFDPLPLTTIYKLSGRLLHIPLRGNGLMHVGMGPIHAIIEIGGELTKVKNVEYYNMTKFRVTLNILNGTFDVHGLFEGDEELGRITNALMNQFGVEIMQAASPMFSGVTEEYFMRYMKWFTGLVPYYKIFPKSHN